MNADQIAEIRPAIREAIEGAPDICVTLEIEGEPKKWMQIVDRTINAAYPHGDVPDGRVKCLGSAHLLTKVVAWEAGKFATFEFVELSTTLLAPWIDGYFVDVLNCDPGRYHINVSCQQL